MQTKVVLNAELDWFYYYQSHIYHPVYVIISSHLVWLKVTLSVSVFGLHWYYMNIQTDKKFNNCLMVSHNDLKYHLSSLLPFRPCFLFFFDQSSLVAAFFSLCADFSLG